MPPPLRPQFLLPSKAPRFSLFTLSTRHRHTIAPRASLTITPFPASTQHAFHTSRTIYSSNSSHPSPSPTPQPTASSPPSQPFRTGPSPPRLPREEQDLFEALQRRSTGAFSTPREDATDAILVPEDFIDKPKERMIRLMQEEEEDAENSKAPPLPHVTSSPTSSSSIIKPPQPTSSSSSRSSSSTSTIPASGNGGELHPDVRRGARPEFEGDVNPQTGEVGGPKNEPLRWGGGGEWSYNGRTTDF